MYKKYAAVCILVLLVIESFHLPAFAQNTEELLHVNGAAEKNTFWSYPEQERADYTCIGKFVTEEAEGFVMTDEPYEYLPEQLQDTRVYQLECIDNAWDYISETYEYDHYYIEDGYSNIITYVYVLMEKSYFDQNFAYDQPFTIKMNGTEEHIEFSTEDGETHSVPLLSLYDQETGQYLNSASLEGMEDLNLEDEAEEFRGQGYFEERVALYENENLSSIMPDAGIYKFHILSDMGESAKNYIYVVCSEKFYEDNKDNGIEILYAKNYGVEYNGQPAWFLMFLTTQEYNTLRIYDLNEMKSWYNPQSNNGASQGEDAADGQERETAVSDMQENNLERFFENVPTIVWVVAGVVLLAIAEGLYILLKKRKQ
jgi:hypothetical protein